ncbi:30S ribosome-binding factor RbfA [Arenicella xantha]|uniref:Ribosome-binding factor A n=1 Tax=Arenicella xantha TaxID=644221 RepID=A0A395JMQ3_9GAMM|nr:30S ribosome-binding factor RbfA [Arenicella xantha]RBP49184.1 ribosome-binding factor A [Arenicella xantha]
MPKEYARSERVAQMIIRHLAVILRNDVKDPRVSSLTVTDVEVTKDLRQAKVFVTTLSDDQVDIADTMEAVDKANGFLRRALAAVIDMRHCPSLIFSYDNSISEGARMSALIDKALNKRD